VIWRAAMRIEARVGDLVRRIGVNVHKLGTRWPDDQEVT
jgi:hypothetical protein